MSTRNVTISLRTDLARQVRVLAAQRDMSVSALIAELLEQLLVTDDDYDQTWEAEQRLMTDGLPMRVGTVTWTRDDIHAR